MLNPASACQVERTGEGMQQKAITSTRFKFRFRRLSKSANGPVSLILLLMLFGLGSRPAKGQPFAKTTAAAWDTINYSIIPAPVDLRRMKGRFSLERPVDVIAPEDWQPTADLLKQAWHLDKARHAYSQPNGVKRAEVRFIKVKPSLLAAMLLKSAKYKDDKTLQDHLNEAYVLTVSPDQITIHASEKPGSIHGLFTLLQLQKLQRNAQQIPTVVIRDYPRFAYRGMMLDVSRNFFPPAYIKKFIDLLALYKFNKFHWHLTDGAGWRLQIKKYPRLTSLAAWRPQGPQTKWSAAGRKYSQEGAPDAYGGYYTTQEAKDIVQYAGLRGITVIPEIEFPGHAEEALAAYPWLSATGKAEGVHELNVCSDSTFTFMENVLTEVMAIFPSTYIHIGGDEASKRSWKDCAACKILMQKKGIQSLEGIQSYAIKRIEKFLHAHGRKLLGWDEITEGGLAPDATVMVWRNPQTGIKVARQNHFAVMTPSKYLYLDHYQSDPTSEPEAIGGYIPLSKVYHYNPLPEDSLNMNQTSYLLGVQANLFTEYVPTVEHADYMLFPRTLAVAEIGWTPAREQHYPDFLRRIQNQYLLLQRENVNYCRPRQNVLYDSEVDTATRSILVTLSSETYQPPIYYTTDGSDPSLYGKAYTGPFRLSGHKVIKAMILQELPKPEINGEKYHQKLNEQKNQIKSTDYSKPVIYTFNSDYHKAIGKKVIYASSFSKSYMAAGDKTLTDGITGTLTYSDDRWQGFLGTALNVTVDMDKVEDLSSLDIRFMQLTGPGVYMPGRVKVLLSDDNINFIAAGEVVTKTSADEDRLRFENYHFDLEGKRARYIKVIAPNVNHGFLFTDEIIIY
ncbi:MAG TPA: family 20 glycosylhydrolase [Arachidicoccus sp.]|nr:family 20 glycosylhydrolase [Arachidicoccus sp.]